MPFTAPPQDIAPTQGFTAPEKDMTKGGGFTAPKEDQDAYVQKLAHDSTFDPKQYAALNPDQSEFARTVQKAKENRDIGEKAGEFAGEFGKGENYVNAAKGVGKFGLGVVAAPLNALDVLGSAAGARMARASGNDELADKLEKRQLTAQAQALLAAQNIEQSLGNTGRIIGRYAQKGVDMIPGDGVKTPEQLDAEHKADFEKAVQTLRNQMQLAEGKPIDTGVIAGAMKLANNQDPSQMASPEVLEASGAEPVNKLLVESMGSAADPQMLAYGVAGKFPGVRGISGALVSGLGKTMQVPGKVISAIPGKIGRLAREGATITGGLETLQNPVLMAKIATATAAAKGTQWIGKAFEEQGNALRTGLPSALDTETSIARATGESAKSANAQRMIGNAANAATSTAVGMAPLNYFMSEGDPRKQAESFISAGGFGAFFGAFDSARPALVEATRPYLRMKGEQSINTNDAIGRKSAEYLNALPEAQRNTALEYMGAFQGMVTKNGKPARLVIQNAADFAETVQSIAGGEAPKQLARGIFDPKTATAYVNGDSPSFTNPAEAAHTMGHEFGGHIGKAILEAMTSKGSPIAEGMMKAVRKELLPDGKPTKAFLKFIDGYNKAFDPTGQHQALDPKSPAAQDEYVAESVAQIIAAKGAAEIALPKSLQDKLQDKIGRFMWGMIGLDTRKIGTQTKFGREEVGKLTQIFHDSLAQIAEGNLRGGQNAGIPEQTAQERIGELQEILATPRPDKTAPAEDVREWVKEQAAARKELKDLQGQETPFPASGEAPIAPSAPGTPATAPKPVAAPITPEQQARQDAIGVLKVPMGRKTTPNIPPDQIEARVDAAIAAAQAQGIPITPENIIFHANNGRFPQANAPFGSPENPAPIVVAGKEKRPGNIKAAAKDGFGNREQSPISAEILNAGVEFLEGEGNPATPTPETPKTPAQVEQSALTPQILGPSPAGIRVNPDQVAQFRSHTGQMAWRGPQQAGLTPRTQRDFVHYNPEEHTQVPSKAMSGVGGTAINPDSPEDMNALMESLKNTPDPSTSIDVVQDVQDAIANGEQLTVSYQSAVGMGEIPTAKERTDAQKLADIGLAPRKVASKNIAPTRFEIYTRQVPRFDDAHIATAFERIEDAFENPKRTAKDSPGNTPTPKQWKNAGFNSAEEAKAAVEKLAGERRDGGIAQDISEKAATLIHDVLSGEEMHLDVLGDSTDKFQANANKLITALEPHTGDQSIRNARNYLIGSQWEGDMVTRRENMAAGYRADGKKFIDRDGNEKPVNPDYKPKKLADFKIQVLNLLEGGTSNTYFQEAQRNIPGIDADPEALPRPKAEELPAIGSNPLETKLKGLGDTLAIGESKGLKNIIESSNERIRLDRIVENGGKSKVTIPPPDYEQQAAGFMPENSAEETKSLAKQRKAERDNTIYRAPGKTIDISDDLQGLPEGAQLTQDGGLWIAKDKDGKILAATGSREGTIQQASEKKPNFLPEEKSGQIKPKVSDSTHERKDPYTGRATILEGMRASASRALRVGSTAYEADEKAITSAAIQTPTGIKTGTSHDEIIKANQLDKSLKNSSKAGFMTSAGQFVDRKKAADIAEKSGQLKGKKPVYLRSHNVDFMPETTVHDMSDDILRKNDNWVQAAWLKMQHPDADLKSVPYENLVAKMEEWRHNLPNAKNASEAYPLPIGFLNNDGQFATARHSADSRASLAAYDEQTGDGPSSALSAKGFREAVKPLVEAAEKSDRVFSPKLLALVAAQGGEHSVIFTPGRLLKVTEPDIAGGVIKFESSGEPSIQHGTLPEYLEQIELNRSLLDDTTRIEGVMQDKKGTRIVTSQDAEHGVKPTYAEVEKAFKEAGFFPIKQKWVQGQGGDELWWHPEKNIGVSDVRPDNLVKTDRGPIIPIDIKAFQPTGKALEWIKKHVDKTAIAKYRASATKEAAQKRIEAMKTL